MTVARREGLDEAVRDDRFPARQLCRLRRYPCCAQWNAAGRPTRRPVIEIVGHGARERVDLLPVRAHHEDVAPVGVVLGVPRPAERDVSTVRGPRRRRDDPVARPEQLPEPSAVPVDREDAAPRFVVLSLEHEAAAVGRPGRRRVGEVVDLAHDPPLSPAVCSDEVQGVAARDECQRRAVRRPGEVTGRSTRGEQQLALVRLEVDDYDPVVAPVRDPPAVGGPGGDRSSGRRRGSEPSRPSPCAFRRRTRRACGQRRCVVRPATRGEIPVGRERTSIAAVGRRQHQRPAVLLGEGDARRVRRPDDARIGHRRIEQRSASGPVAVHDDKRRRVAQRSREDELSGRGLTCTAQLERSGLVGRRAGRQQCRGASDDAE